MLSRKTIELLINTAKAAQYSTKHALGYSKTANDRYEALAIAIAELETALKELEAIKDDPKV